MVQGGMKLGAPGLGHTMDRPYPPLVCEGAVVSRMPVPRGDIEACGATHERVERRNHPITLRDRQGAAWAEIVLALPPAGRAARCARPGEGTGGGARPSVPQPPARRGDPAASANAARDLQALLPW